MRLKELRGMPVIDPTAARKIGTVTDYQVDPASGRLAALDVSGGDRGEGERVNAQRIRRVGSSAVILTARGGAMAGAAPEVSDRWLDTSTLEGLEIMGDDGNRIGFVMDATFDQDTLNVESYVLRAGFLERLLRRHDHIDPDKVHSCSRELMIVTTGRVSDEVVEAPTVSPDTAPLDVRMPLKEADRLAAPSYESVQDGQPVGAKRG